MTQTIKPNDFVYFPTVTTSTLQVKEDRVDSLYVEFGENKYYFNSKGNIDIEDIQPSLWLATAENKAKLEKFYSITLESMPVNKYEHFKETLMQFKKECEYHGSLKFSNTLNLEKLFCELCNLYEKELKDDWQY